MMCLRIAQHRLGKRMLAAFFERGSRLQQRLLAAVCEDIGHGRLALGDGAGLVEHHGLQPAGRFERDGVLKQDAVARTDAAADHARNRRGKSQCARTADDEHGNGAFKRKADALSKQQPDKERDERDADHRGNEDARNAVGDFGDGRLGRRGVAHHLDDLRKRGVLAHTRGAALDIARTADGRRRDPVACRLVNGYALPCQRGFIHGAAALDDHAVHRNTAACADNKHIACLHLGNADLGFGTAALHHGGFGREIHQAFERVGGAPL